MPHKRFRGLTIGAVEGTPAVIACLIKGATPADYDFTPDPDRFTIRGVLAHLADFEPVFRGRMEQARDQERPSFVPRDEAQMAIDNDYAHADPAASLARFSSERVKTVAFLRALSDEQWERVGMHIVAGPITIDEQLDLMIGHDGYHTRQIAEWLAGR